MTDLSQIKQRFGIIGTSETMDRALEVALRVAATDLSVLVTGESGVGKEYFPQVIHAYSSRKHNRYIAVNCGAIPEGTIDSELFGHEKGSFTGATEARKGYFEEAAGGTIFLDEVAELPLATQVRLLRVLQTGEFLRVGSSKVHKTDVRVVAATNIDLRNAISAGRFREDLYYRLNTVPIQVPPLRDRRGDIYLLFRKFAADVAIQYRMPVISLDEQARAVLEDYYWRGNVRQLKNVAEQISAIEESRVITAAILSKYLPDDGSAQKMPVRVGGAESEKDFERELLYKVLFDMRAEINEMRAVLRELVGGGATAEQKERISGLLQAASHDKVVHRAEQDAPAILHATSSDRSASMNNSSPDMGALMQSGARVVGAHDSHIVYHAADNDFLPVIQHFADSEDVTDESHAKTKDDKIRDEIIRALRRNNGRRKEAAAELFMSERTLYRKIKELGIK